MVVLLSIESGEEGPMKLKLQYTAGGLLLLCTVFFITTVYLTDSEDEADSETIEQEVDDENIETDEEGLVAEEADQLNDFEQRIGIGKSFDSKTEPENGELASFIADWHRYFNNLVGYGGYRNIEWGSVKTNHEQLLEEVDEMINTAATEAMSYDFERIRMIAIAANETEGVDHLLHLHRIIHDLDVHYNGYNADYFSYSYYGNEDPASEPNRALVEVKDMVADELD